MNYYVGFPTFLPRVSSNLISCLRWQLSRYVLLVLKVETPANISMNDEIIPGEGSWLRRAVYSFYTSASANIPD